MNTPTQQTGDEAEFTLTPRTNENLAVSAKSPSPAFRLDLLADLTRDLERETAALHAQLGEARKNVQEVKDFLDAIPVYPIKKEVADPHHGGKDKWKLENGTFWLQTLGRGKWVKVNRIHATPARVCTLASLILATRTQETTQ